MARTRPPYPGAVDDAKIIMYQAYNPTIGHYAAAQHQLGGEFDYGRMSWVKAVSCG